MAIVLGLLAMFLVSQVQKHFETAASEPVFKVVPNNSTQ